MRKPLIKTVFAALFVFVFSSASFALSPEDALSVRPPNSVYAVVRVDDLNGLLQDIFSPANIEMAASMVEPENAQTVRLVASFASQIPAKTVVIASGVTADNKPFVQVAASMPASVRSRLNRVADGSASGVELITLLLGDGALMLGPTMPLELKKGGKGPYYTLGGEAAFAAKDDLLLIASSSSEIEASLGALEKQENRLSLKRRFDSPSYWYMHMDMATVAALSEEESGLGKPDDFAKMFKAPFKFETAFSSKPGSFLISAAANILESVAAPERYKDMKPVKGANLFLAGGGRLLLALASPTTFAAADLKAADPKFSAVLWDKLVQQLEKVNVSESDVEDLLNGSFSVALGSDATILGKRALGGYLALTGRKGTAAKILGKLVDSEEFSQAVPMAPLKVDGWDLLFAVDPALLPAALVFGVMQDTFFAGITDSEALDKKPEVPTEVSKMLDDPLLGIGVIDAAAIWNWLRQEIANPDSLLSASLTQYGGNSAGDIMRTILEAELAVPFVKMWYPELEKSFVEFSVADVPAGKRLLPILLEIAKAFISEGGEE